MILDLLIKPSYKLSMARVQLMSWLFMSCAVACSTSPSRAPTINTCDSLGRCSTSPWLTQPGNGTIHSSDSGLDDSSVQIFEVHGTLRNSANFTRDLSTSPVNTQQQIVIGRTAQNEDVQTSALQNGEFTLANIARSQPYTWFRIVQPDNGSPSRLRTRTIFGFELPIPIGSVLNIPIFDDTLPTSSLFTLGNPRILQETDATIVVRIIDQNALPRSGVLAKIRAGAEGPYYDDGDGLTNRSTGTSIRGTIVFLAVPYTWLNFDLSLVWATGEKTLTLPVAASAFTFTQVVIPN